MADLRNFTYDNMVTLIKKIHTGHQEDLDTLESKVDENTENIEELSDLVDDIADFGYIKDTETIYSSKDRDKFTYIEGLETIFLPTTLDDYEYDEDTQTFYYTESDDFAYNENDASFELGNFSSETTVRGYVSNFVNMDNSEEADVHDTEAHEEINNLQNNIDNINKQIINIENEIEQNIITATYTEDDSSTGLIFSRINFIIPSIEFELKPLSECSFKDIQAIVQSGQAADIWSVGDRYPAVLNGDVSTHTFNNETWYMTIIGFDHNTELETDSKPSVTFQFGEAEDGTHICFRDPNYDGGGTAATTGFRMNTSNTNSGGWESSWMRNTVLPQFFEALPIDLQNIIGTVTKYTDNVGGGSGSVENNVTATEDKIFLLSAYETGISAGNSYEYSTGLQKTYSNYYSNNSSRIRYKQFDTSTATVWWLRSVATSNSGNFYNIGTSGSSNNGTAYYSYGLAPALCIF